MVSFINSLKVLNKVRVYLQLTKNISSNMFVSNEKEVTTFDLEKSEVTWLKLVCI